MYERLDKEVIVTELRACSIKFSCTESKKSLSAKLDTVHDMKRVSELMIYNSTSNLAYINLDLYKILFTEPLHDISNHIQNLYAELPFQIEKEYKESFTDIMNVSFNRRK